VRGAVLAFVLLCGAASATGWTTDAPEKAFTYRGKPIDPRCVMAMLGPEEKSGNAALGTCTKPGTITRNRNSFSVDEPPEGAGGMPSDSYEVLGRNGGYFALATDWSGGGTGDFTGLVILRRTGDKLVLERDLLRGGDRCNGGLSNPRLVGNVLHWSEYNTPADVVALGGVEVEAYKDLEASAASCVATRDWVYDLGTGKRRLASLTLFPSAGNDSPSGKLVDQQNWTEQYIFQHCFNAYYNAYIGRRQTTLSPEQVKAFAQGFARTCMKHP
jgi:hypothetical protein